MMVLGNEGTQSFEFVKLSCAAIHSSQPIPSTLL